MAKETKINPKIWEVVVSDQIQDPTQESDLFFPHISVWQVSHVLLRSLCTHFVFVIRSIEMDACFY